MKRIALVTCRVLPEPDPDQAPLLAAIRDAGMHAEMLAWDDPAADPGAFDLCVMRSCWNYYVDTGAFLEWTGRAARRSRLLNGEPVVRWNIHKSYLARLESAGVPVIPTVFFERGNAAAVPAIMDERGWSKVVMKPTVSAASFRTRRFDKGSTAEAQVFMDSLLADGDALMQRYMEGFAATGERALIWIDGEFTHKVIKAPRFEGEDENVSGAQPVSEEERAIGERALACVDEELHYGRVDVVEHDGGLVVSELELMEPSLFLLQSAPALKRFTRTIERVASI